MQNVMLGSLWPVSRLVLGGGGLGQLWGTTSREEAVATVHAAVAGGITLFDLAPLYGRGEAEAVIGEAFAGRPAPELRFTTKCQLGNVPAEAVVSTIRRRLERSLETLRLSRVDLLFLHSNIIPDGYRFPRDSATQDHFATPLSLFRDHVRPAFEKLREEGLIGDWGITGIGLPETVMTVLGEAPRPSVVQCIANCLDSAGSIQRFDEPAQPRNIIATARAHGVGVLGIRAVQAGALTDAIDRPLPADHPEVLDYHRAKPLRALAAQAGMTMADLAHRYALSMDGVDAVILGVKNRQELAECLAAEAAGPLPAELIRAIDECRRSV
jgi:aryl-alcohol dehydrogenase-like predicted oxidoreductase